MLCSGHRTPCLVAGACFICGNRIVRRIQHGMTLLQELNDAARRRMPKQVFVPLPCPAARSQMLRVLGQYIALFQNQHAHSL